MGEPSAVERAELRTAMNATLATISRRVVGLLKEYHGKGPTKARTYLWDDLVVVVLSGGNTTAENTLLRAGRESLVVEQRAELQEVMRQHLERVIEEELRREAVAFMNANHFEPDYHVELFMLNQRSAAMFDSVASTTEAESS